MLKFDVPVGNTATLAFEDPIWNPTPLPTVSRQAMDVIGILLLPMPIEGLCTRNWSCVVDNLAVNALLGAGNIDKFIRGSSPWNDKQFLHSGSS